MSVFLDIFVCFYVHLSILQIYKWMEGEVNVFRNGPRLGERSDETWEMD